MSELKSAWEVAQERAKRLGNLSAEEKEQQEREGYGQIGQALAQKWMDGSQRLDIAEELRKNEEKGRELIKKAVIERLAEAIEFTTAPGVKSLRMAVEGITSLRPELQPRAEEIEQLVQEYELAEQNMRQELESSYRETLHQLRISGTAVGGINIEDNDRCQAARQRLVDSFASRLDALKQALLV
jgi:predicted dinucleotide-utilizing enzyme